MRYSSENGSPVRLVRSHSATTHSRSSGCTSRSHSSGSPIQSAADTPNKGSHFAAWEQPQLFTEEVPAAFRSLRLTYSRRDGAHNLRAVRLSSGGGATHRPASRPAGATGWVVLHDLAVPRSQANIDHWAIGPSGCS
jgi:hypothetical protein